VLGVPAGAIHCPEPRPLARAAPSLTAGAARGLSAWRPLPGALTLPMPATVRVPAARVAVAVKVILD
jgi:hypothetical protein